MPTIFTIGETIYDIIFDQSEPKAAKAGGSMLNTAVSLGRCGMKVEMITELGDDLVGKQILDFLEENGVSTSFIKPVEEFKTPVSLAFLDGKGEAHYSFYKNYPDNRLNITWPEAKRGDVVLFGSFYSLDRAIRDQIISFVRKAKLNGAKIIYDPNIRKNHMGEIRSLISLVEENIALADIVRGSDEDFMNLFGLTDDELIFKQVHGIGCTHLIITKGDKGAFLFSQGLQIQVPAKKIETVSTIGAGDAFNAGMISGMIRLGFTANLMEAIDKETWYKIIDFGINFASDVCCSYDNYIAHK